MPAFGAFERPVFDAVGPIGNTGRSHPRLALGTARALDRQQFGLGSFPARHNGKKNSQKLKVRLLDSRPVKLKLGHSIFQNRPLLVETASSWGAKNGKRDAKTGVNLYDVTRLKYP
jgi:hypothetical protein